MSPEHANGRRAAIATLALALVACGGEPTSAPPAARFTLDVTHDPPYRLAGDALFTPDLANSDIGTAFAFRSPAGGGAVTHSLALYRLGTTGLERGDHPVAPGNEGDPPGAFRATIALDRNGTDRRTCYATAGTLRVTEVTPERAAGELRLEGRCERDAEPGVSAPFTATGAFVAAAGLPGPGEWAGPAA